VGIRCHIIGVPYSKVTSESVLDAFPYKQYKFIKMMSGIEDMEFIFYGHKDSEVPCEVVPCFDDATLRNTYGDFSHDSYYWFGAHINDYAHETLNSNAAKHIRKILKPNDLILNFWQFSAVPLWEKYGLPYDNFVDIGHGAECLPVSKYASYESYALYNFIHGVKTKTILSNTCVQNPDRDAVIPLMTDMDHFEFQEKKEDYYFYVGRLVALKGIDTVMRLAYEFPERKFIIAGYIQGTERQHLWCDIKENGQIKKLQWDEIVELPNVEFIGTVGVEEKKGYYMNAKALLVPTLYSEPFGGVVSEAHACGTPVISTDWGAFSENNVHGLTGIRCRTYDCWRKALDEVEKIDPKNCRKYVEDNYSLEVVSVMYENFLRRCYEYVSGKTQHSEGITYKQNLRKQGCQYL